MKSFLKSLKKDERENSKEGKKKVKLEINVSTFVDQVWGECEDPLHSSIQLHISLSNKEFIDPKVLVEVIVKRTCHRPQENILTGIPLCL